MHMTHHPLFTLKLTTILFSILLLFGCDRPMPDLDLTPQVNKLFSALQSNDIDTALTMYSDEFYKGIPKQYWRAQLQKFHDHMGAMESFRIRNKQADTRFSGKFFVFQLDTVHQGQKKARHILTYVLPVDGSDVRLVGHKITAKGFN